MHEFVSMVSPLRLQNRSMAFICAQRTIAWAAACKWKELKFDRLKSNWVLQTRARSKREWKFIDLEKPGNSQFPLDWGWACVCAEKWVERRFYANMHSKQSACTIPSGARKKWEKVNRKSRLLAVWMVCINYSNKSCIIVSNHSHTQTISLSCVPLMHSTRIRFYYDFLRHSLAHATRHLARYSYPFVSFNWMLCPENQSHLIKF